MGIFWIDREIEVDKFCPASGLRSRRIDVDPFIRTDRDELRDALELSLDGVILRDGREIKRFQRSGGFPVNENFLDGMAFFGDNQKGLVSTGNHRNFSKEEDFTPIFWPGRVFNKDWRKRMEMRERKEANIEEKVSQP